MEDPVFIDKDKVLVDCYRFKVEITDKGEVRIYAYNTRKKGDVELTIHSGKIILVRENGKSDEILKERISEVVLKRVFTTEG